jgi:hypothetical protein
MTTPLNRKQVEALKQVICGIVLHWTAGTYSATFKHYHFNIKWDGEEASVVQTLSVRERGAHTWRRNTGRIGISLCGAAKGFPIHKGQIEAMAKLAAELCFLFEIDPTGTHTAMDLYDTTKFHNVQNVTDHVLYGKMDKYGKPDIGELLPVVLNKMQWYYSKLKSGEHKLKYVQDIY